MVTRYQADTYTIEKGDSVYGVARKLGIPYERMLEANPDLDKPQNISIGQKINLPLQEMHLMQEQDTFFNLAERYHIELKDLKRVNPEITDMNHIRVGTQIRIPYPLAAMKKTTLQELQHTQPPPTPKTATSYPAAPTVTPEKFTSVVFTGLKPASTKSVSYNIPDGATDNAWSMVEGRPVSSVFKAAAYDPRPLIVIDPGHGAYSKTGKLDEGYVSKDQIAEVDIVDPVATSLSRQLANAGYRVAFTRNPGEVYRYKDGDQHGGRLASRAHFAHALGSQLGAAYTLFVSIHANTSGSELANGTEVQIDNSLSGRDGPPTSQYSKALAQSVLGRIDGFDGLHNRGIKTYNACVLDTMERKEYPGSQPDAAILIEVGFLSNNHDSNILQQIRQNPDQFASCIAQGVTDHVVSRETPADPSGSTTAILATIPGLGGGNRR